MIIRQKVSRRWFRNVGMAALLHDGGASNNGVTISLIL
jgi:hypothetical protein